MYDFMRFVPRKRFRWYKVATQDALPAEDIFALRFIIFHYLYESYRILEKELSKHEKIS